MSPLEEARWRKLEELQAQAQHQQDAQQQLAQAEQAIKQLFSKEALARYGNIRAAQPQVAAQLIVVLAQLIQQGRVQQVDDALLRKILGQLGKKREMRIIRR